MKLQRFLISALGETELTALIALFLVKFLLQPPHMGMVNVQTRSG